MDDLANNLRHKSLPKRYRQRSHWNRMVSSLSAYREALLGDMFFAGPSVIAGTGLFAACALGVGDYAVLFGECHKISRSQQARLERQGEGSFLKGFRLEYFGGPLSLVNHACPPACNAEYVVWNDDPSAGHRLIGLRILKRVEAGDEILVDYGDEWWSDRDIECHCPECCGAPRLK